MEVKLLELTADDGHIYKAVGFRDTGATSEDAAAAYEEGRAAGYEAGYDIGKTDGNAEGVAAGREAAEAECAAKHFTAEFVGDGTGVAVLPNLFFAPTRVAVSCVSQTSGSPSYTLKSAIYDKDTPDTVGGATLLTDSNANITPSKLSKSTANDNRFLLWDEANSTLTISLPDYTAVGGMQATFGAGLTYRVLAE